MHFLGLLNGSDASAPDPTLFHVICPVLAEPWRDDCERVLVDVDHLYLVGSYRIRGSGLPDWRIEFPWVRH